MMREECEISSMLLKKLRASNKLTQADMACMAECSLRNYQNYEHGKSQPSYSILNNLIRNLPADPRELFECDIYDVDNATRNHINHLLSSCSSRQLQLTLKIIQGIVDEWPKQNQ